MTKERHFRSSPRPVASLQVVIKVQNTDPVTTLTVTTRDVSTGGMFVYTDYPFKINDMVTLDLATLSTWEPLTLKGRVCRVVEGNDRQEPGIGLQFVDVSDTDLVALIHLTTSLDFES